MTSIREFIRRRFATATTLPPGKFSYQSSPDSPLPYRLHLRLEEDGSGILVVNAATVLHLNPTAAEYIFHHLQGLKPEEVTRIVAERYRVSQEQAAQDYRDLIDRIHTLIEMPDLDPVTYLDFDLASPHSHPTSAPYRLDCALTYRLAPGSPLEVSPTDRVDRELTTQEWIAILDKAWSAGIPHVVFTGGEPSLREDLPELVAHAESIGQVAGLLTSGYKLSDPGFLGELLQTGLDHLTLIPDLEAGQTWANLDQLIAADLFVSVHLTITPQNASQFDAYLERLATAGVRAISISEIDPVLSSTLHEARQKAADLGMELVWGLPVPYSALNPVSLETHGLDIPPGAAQAWLYVEPDGDVLPAQGVLHDLGNLLRDPWEQVWGAAQEYSASRK